MLQFLSVGPFRLLNDDSPTPFAQRPAAFGVAQVPSIRLLSQV